MSTYRPLRQHCRCDFATLSKAANRADEYRCFEEPNSSRQYRRTGQCVDTVSAHKGVIW